MQDRCKICNTDIDPRESYVLIVGHRGYQWPAHKACAKGAK